MFKSKTPQYAESILNTIRGRGDRTVVVEREAAPAPTQAAARVLALRQPDVLPDVAVRHLGGTLQLGIAL